ncbi:MAG: zf-HC2 domain-containing protein [Actinomycetota bacterium]
MMEKCFDEGTLQAFLDNELPLELSQRIARHMVDCDPCAILLAEVEEETAFTFTALEQEFNTLVPTMRLWTKINDSIETQSRNRSVWQKLLSFVAGLNLLNPQIIAFGSLLLIVGVVSVLLVMKEDTPAGRVAVNSSVPTIQTAKINDPTPPVDVPVTVPANATPSKNPASQYSAENANYVERNERPLEKPFVNPKPKPFVPQYLDGEESYVSTISRLEKTVDSSKDEVLKPAARFSYEKDLAVVNDTITKMKREVKKNPKNEDAKQVLFSSYQNKIELLNSVTQRGELMASLR